MLGGTFVHWLWHQCQNIWLQSTWSNGCILLDFCWTDCGLLVSPSCSQSWSGTTGRRRVNSGPWGPGSYWLLCRVQFDVQRPHLWLLGIEQTFYVGLLGVGGWLVWLWNFGWEIFCVNGYKMVLGDFEKFLFLLHLFCECCHLLMV